MTEQPSFPALFIMASENFLEKDQREWSEGVNPIPVKVRYFCMVSLVISTTIVPTHTRIPRIPEAEWWSTEKLKRKHSDSDKAIHNPQHNLL